MQKELPKGGPCSKSVSAPGQEIWRTCLKTSGVVNGIDSFLKSALSLGLCTTTIREGSGTWLGISDSTAVFLLSDLITNGPLPLFLLLSCSTYTRGTIPLQLSFPSLLAFQRNAVWRLSARKLEHVSSNGDTVPEA